MHYCLLLSTFFVLSIPPFWILKQSNSITSLISDKDFMTDKFYCMLMRINIDCNGCYRKVRRALLDMRGLETHMIEKKECRVMVYGRFSPQDVAIKIRKKTNRRVEILDIQELISNTNNNGGDDDENHEQSQRPLINSWNLISNYNQVETCVQSEI